MMTDKIDTSPEAVASMLKRLTFEAVNGEIDKAFAGEIGTHLRALSARIAELESERDHWERWCKVNSAAAKRMSDLSDVWQARDEAAEANLAKAEAALIWYGEQARLARLIHKEGDAGRHAIASDGGKRARAILAEIQTETKENDT